MSRRWIKRLTSLITIVSVIGCSTLPCLAEAIEMPVEPDTVNTIVEDVESSQYEKISDPDVLPYIEDTLYSELVGTINSEEYFVENVDAIYISQEYLDELFFNSKANVFFGYSLADLDKQFQGEKYIFTLGDNNATVVEPWEDYDTTYDQILKNVAVGTGVILICVTVSVVTAGTGAYAASMIFAVAAKSGAVGAASGAALGGVAAGIVTGIQTGDMEEALKAGALASSEGFKWGAITGAISGGVGEGIALKGATLNGLSMNEAAFIQKKTKLPLQFIKNFHSMDEYNIYVEAGLSQKKIGKAFSFWRNVDMDNVITDQYGKTMTNAERIMSGKSPVDPSGVPYELHHIGQQPDAPLAILTKGEHMQGGNNKVLHWRVDSEVDHDYIWTKQVTEFWKAYLDDYLAVTR